MSDESPEGFAKKGTTLEGRVAQLLRIMGYDVTRNIIMNDHEIDVYAEKNGHKIIVECKEYYTQLISRDLILIFATKTRDITPNEAWFVTINDFENSALELCKRYRIRSINGYQLEELEDQAASNFGEVSPGKIPTEDRILRTLKRKATELSSEGRRTNEIRKTIDKIHSMQVQTIKLPPYLFPASESDLESKYIWLSKIEAIPKIVETGQVTEIIVNFIENPRIKGFKIETQKTYNLAAFVILATIFICTILAFQNTTNITQENIPYIAVAVIVSASAWYYRERIVYHQDTTENRSSSDAEIGEDSIYFPRSTSHFEYELSDMRSSDSFNVPLNLVDLEYLGETNDFVVEKDAWNIRAVKVSLRQDIFNDVGSETALIPYEYVDYDVSDGEVHFKVKALYALSDEFLQTRKMI